MIDFCFGFWVDDFLWCGGECGGIFIVDISDLDWIVVSVVEVFVDEVLVGDRLVVDVSDEIVGL